MAYPELIRYPYQNRISSDNGILGNWLSRAVTKSHIPRSGLIGTWAETEAIFCDSSPYFGRNFWQSLSASTGTRTFPFARNAAGAKILCSEFPTHIPIESAGALS